MARVVSRGAAPRPAGAATRAASRIGTGVRWSGPAGSMLQVFSGAAAPVWSGGQGPPDRCYLPFGLFERSVGGHHRVGPRHLVGNRELRRDAVAGVGLRAARRGPGSVRTGSRDRTPRRRRGRTRPCVRSRTAAGCRRPRKARSCTSGNAGTTRRSRGAPVGARASRARRGPRRPRRRACPAGSDRASRPWRRRPDRIGRAAARWPVDQAGRRRAQVDRRLSSGPPGASADGPRAICRCRCRR